MMWHVQATNYASKSKCNARFVSVLENLENHVFLKIFKAWSIMEVGYGAWNVMENNLKIIVQF